MPGRHDQLIDLVQELRRQEADVVDECLIVGVLIIRDAVPQHLADVDVFIHQFMESVSANIPIEAHHTAHPYFPHLHARSAIVLVHLRRNLCF